MRLLFCCFTVVLAMTSCQNEGKRINHTKKQSKENCKELHEIGFDYMQQFMLQRDSMLYDSAIRMFDLSLNCDSDYLPALHNKYALLCEEGRYNEALVVVNKLLAVSDSNTTILIGKAILLDSLGRFKEAECLIDLSARRYDKRIKHYPDCVRIQFEMLSFEYYYKDKKEAIIALEKLHKLHPENETISSFIDLVLAESTAPQ